MIRQAAPKGSRIKQSVGKRFNKNRRKGIHEAKAGLNVGSKNGTAPHAHFFVLGTQDRFTKRGDFRGRVWPNKFVRRAVNGCRGTTSKIMIEKIQARLPIEVARLRRKLAKP